MMRLLSVSEAGHNGLVIGSLKLVVNVIEALPVVVEPGLRV
jgi:hypothetical protein